MIKTILACCMVVGFLIGFLYGHFVAEKRDLEYIDGVAYSIGYGVICTMGFPIAYVMTIVGLIMLLKKK
jgi:hypothetical protein